MPLRNNLRVSVLGKLGAVDSEVEVQDIWSLIGHPLIEMFQDPQAVTTIFSRTPDFGPTLQVGDHQRLIAIRIESPIRTTLVILLLSAIRINYNGS